MVKSHTLQWYDLTQAGMYMCIYIITIRYNINALQQIQRWYTSISTSRFTISYRYTTYISYFFNILLSTKKRINIE